MTTTPPIEVRLSNGIPVILQPYEGAVAATYWWIKTGSADEKLDEAGFAHFLEHMLFKDAAAKETGRASDGQLARMIESLGGDINAYTSFDQTVYHVTCAAHHWERILDAFGTMAKPQKFLKSDFEREREVILEELRKNEDSPNRMLFQELFKQTYHKHPYGKPVIGYVKTLKAATVAKLEAFYRRQYVSENMGLLLVGPVATLGDSETSPKRRKLMGLLEKRFGKKAIPQRKATETKRVVEPTLRATVAQSVLEFDVQTPSLSLSFRVPELEHSDAAALDLLTSVLGMGELGRLYQALFYGKSLVTDVGAGVYVPKDPGMLYLEADFDSVDKARPIFDEMLAQIERIKHEGPTVEELARVMVNAESEKLYSTQSADGMAGRLGFLRYVLGDMSYDERYLSELRAVSSDRIRQVARKYLTADRMAIVGMVPKGKAAELDLAPFAAAARERLGTTPQAATAVRKAPGDSPVQHWTLDNGIQVALFERPQSNVFSIQAAAMGGLRAEDAAEWGVSHILSQTWTKGTSTKSAKQIAQIVEGSAAGIDGFSGRNSLGLQVTGLAKDFEKLTDLFWEALWDASFPEEEIEHSRRVTEDAIKGIEDHSGQLCSKLFLETLYETHPYRRHAYGTLETLRSLSTQKLKAAHRRWIRPENLVLAISGRVTREQVDAWILKSGAARKSVDVGGRLPFVTRLTDEPELKAPRWVEKTFGREQVHVIVGGLGTKIHSDERFALRLLSNILSGQSGRLFIELREKKSLAYTISPLAFEGIERGYMGTYMASAPGKREEALSGIRAVLEKLAAKGPTPAEMKRAQEFYLGRRAMDLQTDSALATHYGLELLYQLPVLTDAQLATQVRKVTAAEVRAVCTKYMVDNHQVTALVG